MGRIEGSVGQHQIAEPADRGAHHVQLVVHLIPPIEPLVLQHQRDVVHAPALGQRQPQALLVVEDEEPGQPHGHLMAGLPVGVGVIPAGGRRLLDAKRCLPLFAGGDAGLRAAIGSAGHLQPVPMDRGGLRQLVGDPDSHRLPLAGTQSGAEQVAVVAPAMGRLASPLHLARLYPELEHAAGIRLQQRRNRQGWPLGGKRPAPPGQGAGNTDGGGEFEKIATLHESFLVGQSGPSA